MADNFTITNQVPVTDSVPGGTFVPAMEITFTTKPHNIVGKVRIPTSHYDTDHVMAVVAAHATKIEAVQEL